MSILLDVPMGSIKILSEAWHDINQRAERLAADCVGIHLSTQDLSCEVQEASQKVNGSSKGSVAWATIDKQS